MTRYAKAIVAALTLVMAELSDVLADNIIGLPEWGRLLTVVVVSGIGVWGVFRVPNATDA